MHKGNALLGGIRYVDHLGLTVPDLDEAVDFFVNVFGCEELYRSRRSNAAEYMVSNFAVDPAASFTLSMLRCEPNLNIELFQWSAPDQRTAQPRASDNGAHHLSFYVEDVDNAVAQLAGLDGVVLLGTPKTVEAPSPLAGSRWVYFLTPWGLRIELINRSKVVAPLRLIGEKQFNSQ